MTQGRDQSQGALLPCPFCGAAARTDLLPYPDSPGWVQCSSCECHQNMTDTLDEAVRRWNTRAPVFAPAALPPSNSQLSELDDASNACLELAAKHSFATGHGDTVGDMIREFSAQIPQRSQAEMEIVDREYYEGIIAELRAELVDALALAAKLNGGEELQSLMKRNNELIVLVEEMRACAQFVRWALQEGSWQGCDLDGGSVQDKAEALGLISKVPYDPAKHGESEYAKPGSDWYVPTDALTAMALPSTERDRHG